MEKFQVYHSYIEIPNYNMGDCVALENLLSVWDKTNFCRDNIALHYDNLSKVLRIPRGVSPSYVEYLTGKTAEFIRIANAVEYMKGVTLKVKPRDEKQQSSIDFLTGAGKFKWTKEQSQLLLELETGVGKTYCTIAAIVKEKIKGAIILDEIKLIDTWHEKILQYTNIKDKDICIISGSDSIKAILSKKGSIHYNIYLMSNSTLVSYCKSEGYEALNKFFKKIKVGVKVFDEAHSTFRKIVQIDTHVNVKKTIYLTATAGRSDIDGNRVYKNAFKNVSRFGNELFTEDDKYINTLFVKFNSTPSLNDKIKCQTIHGFSADAYLDYNLKKTIEYDNMMCDDSTKLASIANVLNSFKPIDPRPNIYSILHFLIQKFTVGSTGKIAIMFSKNDHIKKFKEYLLNYYNEEFIGIFSSIVSKDKKFEQLNKRIILTTDMSFGKGTDVKDLKCLINTIPYKSSILARQFQGRTRKSKKFKVWYIELIDIGFNDCIRQFGVRKKSLEKKSICMKELKI